MIDEAGSMIESAGHEVDIIVDYREATRQVPTKYLPAISRFRQLGNKNRSRTVVVNAPHFIKSMLGIAQEFAPAAFSNLFYAKTIEEAYSILGHDPAAAQK